MSEICLFVTGPESTGTRWTAATFAHHPGILGPTQDHHDLLDDFWSGATDSLPNQVVGADERYFLTRRSIPSGRAPGLSAEFMVFDDFMRLHAACKTANIGLHLLITTRSPVPALLSSAHNRQSVQGSPERALEQYWAAYSHIFEFIHQARAPFFILSLEGLVNEGADYIDAVMRYFGLEAGKITVDGKIDINKKYYAPPTNP